MLENCNFIRTFTPARIVMRYRNVSVVEAMQRLHAEVGKSVGTEDHNHRVTDADMIV